MKAVATLDDFGIIDKWSKSDRYPRLLEAKEDKTNPINHPKALILEYEANQAFEACPYHVTLKMQKPLHIVALMPLINELQRAMNAAFEGQKLDFEYF